MSFAIGITTFKARFDRVKNLITSIRSRGNWTIILAVNGEFNEPIDEDYRKKILNLASETPNCIVSMFPEFRSLAKLWNTILISSPNDWNLILNDDVIIDANFSFESLSNIADNHKETEAFAINGSWSHYFINRRLVEEVGWFEEKLLGIGEEDTDMFWRLEEIGKKVHKPTMVGIINAHDGSRPSGVKTGVMHYTAYNRDFIFNKKYSKTDSGIEGMFGEPRKLEFKTINSYPNEKFYWNNKNILKD
jgi:hypothetical protein